MIEKYQRITIVRSSKPTTSDINEHLQWFGTCVGLFSLRDKEKSNFRIFIELLKAGKKNQDLSSDDLAEILKLSRGTVVHHLNKLIEAGIVVSHRNRYELRVSKLSQLTEEIEKDTKRAFEDLKEVAQDLDRRLGL